MKIASFHINDINSRQTNLLDWLREAEPDVVCLQELKTTDADFPAEASTLGSTSSTKLPDMIRISKSMN